MLGLVRGGNESEAASDGLPFAVARHRITAALQLRLKRNPDVVVAWDMQQVVISGTSNSWQSTGKIRKWWSCTRQ
jgi:hypothetical protein